MLRREGGEWRREREGGEWGGRGEVDVAWHEAWHVALHEAYGQMAQDA